jgi:hypothetical protein
MADDGGVWVKVYPDDGDSGGDLAWGDFTTNGDETTSSTWGPDADGRMWKYAEWNSPNDPDGYEIDLGNGGLFWVLCVGGGDGGYTTNSGYNQGQPGNVNEGLWEFGPGTHTVTVGKASKTVSSSKFGMPSSIRDRVSGYGTQGKVSFGEAKMGRGATDGPNEPTGYKSRITGNELEYATGLSNSDQARPGMGGRVEQGNLPNDGCVIIATAAPNTKALNWVTTTYHAEVSDGLVTAVHTQKHYADGTTTPLPASELIDATYGVSAGWLFVDGELQPPPPPPEPTIQERIDALKAQIKDLQKDA